MKKTVLTLLALLALATASAQENKTPLVYDVENTGSKFAAPMMPAADQLPIIRDLPDALEGVKKFKNWSKRRSDIGHMIQHYGIGTKPAVTASQVKAHMDGDTLVVDVTVGQEVLTLKSHIRYPKTGQAPYALMIGTDMIALPRQLFEDRPIATATFVSAQVNDYKQFGKHHDRGEHHFDRLYPALKDNGAYSEWAWGMSRLIDGLQQLGPKVTKIDTKHIGVTGCSYAGKMALYCGAFDERIALVIAQEPGGGGAAAWRKSHEFTLAGKNLEDIDKTDYHWFLESQKENFHGDSVYRLPYDQHELCAMVCPRALLLLGNPDYEWLADGSMLSSAEAAKKVWEHFGIGDRMGWSIVGKHGHCRLPETQYPEVLAFIDRFLLGRDVKTNDIKRVEDLTVSTTWTAPADWFKTDTITIKGRIEGYDAEQFGYTSMECYFEDVFNKDASTIVLEIAPDGTFCKKFKASYPVKQNFHSNNSNNGFHMIPFFARPGETIDITVRKDVNGEYQCIYNNGSSRDAQHWLRDYDLFNNITEPLHFFKGTLAEANKKADEVWKNLTDCLQDKNRLKQYSPMEMQLAQADAQTCFAYAVMDYFMYRESDLAKQELRDGRYYRTITDSVEWKGIRDEKSYTALHHVDFNNPLMFASCDFPMLVNRIQFAKPVRKRQLEDIVDEDGSYENTVANALKGLNSGYAGLRDLMGTKIDNLMAQICKYKDMVSDFNTWRNNENDIPNILADTTMTEEERKQGVEELPILSKMYPPYLATFTNPYIHQKAEQYYAYKMAQKDVATPLPNAPMADLIHKLTAKYPGKFLMIDFWGMGCGPCRSAIQSSKQQRAEIAKRNDIKLVFIAGERTTEGSDAYKKYVAEWLADEETVCLTYQDYARLQELFGFNGIPHYETITPEGYRVRDDLRISNFYNFDYDLQRLKEKLK